MLDLNNSFFVISLFAALFSFLVLPALPALADESSSTSKVTFHVA